MSLPKGIINRALKLAEESEYYPFKISAVVFKGGRILSEGKNRIGSSRKIQEKDKLITFSIHAEAEALSKIDDKQSKGASLLVIRMNAGTKHLSNSKPCELCQRLIHRKGIKYVYISERGGEFVKYKVVTPDSKFEVDSEKTEHSYSDKFILRLG